MPHTTNCKVSFDDNPERVYYGGQTVRGRIHLTLAKEKTIRGNCQIFQRFISIISLLFCMRWQYQLEFIVFFIIFFWLNSPFDFCFLIINILFTYSKLRIKCKNTNTKMNSSNNSKNQSSCHVQRFVCSALYSIYI